MIRKMHVGDSLVISVVPFSVKAQRKDIFRIGQEWRSSKNQLSIIKKWDRFFVAKDKFGDERKYSEDELKASIKKWNLKLIEDKSRDAAIRRALEILKPFLGPGISGLASTIKFLIEKN